MTDPKKAPAADDSRNAAKPAAGTGRVVHDERGNAIWDWVKETGRIAIGSTSRLLRKLESPELKMEDDKEPAARGGGGRDSGGGYDPYNQPTKPRRGSKR